MRKLLYISLFFTIISMVMSCGRSTDKRLVLADTLMWTNPDSSLAILESINLDSLQGDENQAYYALLLTQAQFRVDYAIPSDSLINIAVDYYCNNNNREHYTRSLLYKGAFYEVNDNPVEAIKWYKQAEDNADTTDYRNLAQINMRMGILYYKNYASNNLDLEKFKKAYNYYNIIKDKRMTMVALSFIGNLNRESNKGEAIKCLTKAKDMALELNDTSNYYLYLNNLSMAFFMDSSYHKAKEAAIECIKNTIPSNDMLFNAANAYAELNMPDSANLYLNKLNVIDISDYDRMMTAFCKARIARAEGHNNEALRQENLATAISDTIKAKSKRNVILETENKMDTKLNQGNRTKISNMRVAAYFSLMFFLLMAALLAFYMIKNNLRHKRLLGEIQQNQALIRNLIEENQRNINNLQTTNEQNDSLKQKYIIQSRITDYLNDYFNTFNYLLQKSHALSHKEFVNEFKNTVAEASQDDMFWDIIDILANKKSNNLVSKLKEEHPSLTNTDLRIICLICLGYKNDAIAACTGLEKNSVKSTKTKIKNIIGASINLDAFITLAIHNKTELK